MHRYRKKYKDQYKISKFVLKELQEKYPEINAQEFIDDFLNSILNELINYGYFRIRRFGVFSIKKAFSINNVSWSPRIKFLPSITLKNKIKSDPYIMINLKKLKSKIDDLDLKNTTKRPRYFLKEFSRRKVNQIINEEKSKYDHIEVMFDSDENKNEK